MTIACPLIKTPRTTHKRGAVAHGRAATMAEHYKRARYAPRTVLPFVMETNVRKIRRLREESMDGNSPETWSVLVERFNGFVYMQIFPRCSTHQLDLQANHVFNAIRDDPRINWICKPTMCFSASATSASCCSSSSSKQRRVSDLERENTLLPHWLALSSKLSATEIKLPGAA